MFYKKGITAASTGTFTNVQSSDYSSSTEILLTASIYLSFDDSFSSGDARSTSKHAWAVRDRDVAAVPVPAGAWLFGSALGLLGWFRRKLTLIFFGISDQKPGDSPGFSWLPNAR